jgi:polar amino acid transport system permease protein
MQDVVTYWVVLARGLGWTLLLSAGALVLGGVLGILVGFMRLSRWPALRWLAAGYIELFRSIPPLILFFGSYYGLSFALGISLTPYFAATLALTLFCSPLIAEVLRSSVGAIPKGQWEASAAQGMTKPQQIRYVIWPQAFRTMLPAAVGVYVSTLKDSSLASIIGFVELTKAGLLIRETTGNCFAILLTVAVLYFILNYLISAFGAWLERRSAFVH